MKRKRKRMKKVIAGTTVLALAVTTVMATETRDINLGLKLGTLGLGIDASTPIKDNLSVRFNLNGFSITKTDSQDGNDFKGTLDLFTAGALLDYYPFENNFRLSSGLYYNGNGFTGNVKPSAGTDIEIDGTTYTTNDIASVDSDISFNTIAPYLGIGWGNDAHDKGWGFTFDLGVMYHGEGRADLKANVINNAIAQQIEADIKAEEKSINDDLAKIKFYPVVTLGVNYTF
jgi:hypothetical protein